MGLREHTPTTIEEYNNYKTKYSNWGRWGNTDQKGTLNHINADVTKQALSLVRNGISISCANPIATKHVIPDERRNPRPADHQMTIGPSTSADYIGVFYHGFVNTHIDSLCHFFTGNIEDGGRMYNNMDPKLVTEDGALANSIENWRDGIVTRGVLYDIPVLRGEEYVSADQPVEGWELEDWASQVGIEPRDGDAILIRSGYEPFWKANPDFEFSRPPNTPGNSPSIIEYLYETNAALMGWDLQEAGKRVHDYPARIPIHEVVIPYMGMPLLDNANFERLSETCRQLGRYDFLLFISPLVINGGTGSPVNPLAVF